MCACLLCRVDVCVLNSRFTNSSIPDLEPRGSNANRQKISPIGQRHHWKEKKILKNKSQRWHKRWELNWPRLPNSQRWRREICKGIKIKEYWGVKLDNVCYLKFAFFFFCKKRKRGIIISKFLALTILLSLCVCERKCKIQITYINIIKNNITIKLSLKRQS